MAYAASERRRERGEGAGWLTFAAVIMIMAGVMRVIDALWAFDKDDELSEGMQTLLWDDNLTAYGWLWLAVGALLVAAGFGVLSGAEWARWFGIGAAAFAAISATLWMYVYPIWSLIYILVAVMVIYALANYGGRDNYSRLG